MTIRVGSDGVTVEDDEYEWGGMADIRADSIDIQTALDLSYRLHLESLRMNRALV